MTHTTLIRGHRCTRHEGRLARRVRQTQQRKASLRKRTAMLRNRLMSQTCRFCGSAKAHCPACQGCVYLHGECTRVECGYQTPEPCACTGCLTWDARMA